MALLKANHSLQWLWVDLDGWCVCVCVSMPWLGFVLPCLVNGRFCLPETWAGHWVPLLWPGNQTGMSFWKLLFATWHKYKLLLLAILKAHSHNTRQVLLRQVRVFLISNTHCFRSFVKCKILEYSCRAISQCKTRVILVFRLHVRHDVTDAPVTSQHGARKKIYFDFIGWHPQMNVGEKQPMYTCVK